MQKELKREESTNATFRVSQVTFLRASAKDVERGLLGYVTCTLNDGLGLGGLTLRRSRYGRLMLSFPRRRDSLGRNHPLVRPLEDRTRREIEEQVIKALGFDRGKTVKP